ncbi:MAG: 16S rRNA (uracil(1498)-N(3))-methyltransferase [Saprospiraceae bacterium]|nr:16S rRNA (uracil(1498)-N(3))-methyltransferase [Saprospiraceae bacterium]
MQYYFSQEIKGDKTILLSGEEHQHCSKVMRHKRGDTLYVLDGKGHIFETVIGEINRNDTHLIIQKKIEKPEAGPQRYIAISPTKNPSRLEWFIEKATELGITGFIIIFCHRTDKKPVKTERLQKIIVSALKQSGRTVLPTLRVLDKFENMAEIPGFMLYKKFIAHCEKNEEHLLSKTDKKEDQLVCIGPEGDFTPSEIDWSIERGFIPVSLGSTRLRTETAGLYAATCLVLP